MQEMGIMKIYCVVVETRLNQVAYMSLKSAQDFILNRNDKPVCMCPFMFKSKKHTYYIMEVSVND